MINIFKVLFVALTIVISAEVAKRSTFWGALIIVMPLNSILSLSLLYMDTKDSTKVASYAKEIFILVPASLLFFLPFLFNSKTGWPFWVNFGLGLTLMLVSLLLTVIVKRFL